MANDYSSVTVVGIGGPGSSTVEYLDRWGAGGARCVVMNTDPVSLGINLCYNKLLLGAQDPAKDKDAITQALEGARLVLLVAGLGHAGTDATPVVARIAKQAGATVVALVFTPFSYEGKTRQDHARHGIEQLKATTDWTAVLSNDDITERADPLESISSVFATLNESIRKWVLVLPTQAADKTGTFDAALIERGFRESELGELLW